MPLGAENVRKFLLYGHFGHVNLFAIRAPVSPGRSFGMAYVLEWFPAPATFRRDAHDMNAKRLARRAILAASITLVLLAVALIASIHLHGNHALGPDGSWFQVASSVLITCLACGTTLLLALLLFSCKRILGQSYKPGVMFALLLVMEGSTLFWLREGINQSVHAKDSTHQSGAAIAAWQDVESKLVEDIARAEQVPVNVTSAQAQVDAARAEIADLVQEATSMDNDGNGANDRLIPGLLARVESKKADLANLEASLERLRDNHAAAVSVAVAALASHRATWADVLASDAAAKADQHQLERFAAALGAMFPRLNASQAYEVALLLFCLPLMAFQYAGIVGINAAIQIEVEAPQPVAQTEDEEDESSDPILYDQAPENVVAFEVPSSRDARKRLLRQMRRAGVVNGFSSKDVGFMTSDELTEHLNRAMHSERFRQLVAA